MSHRMASSQYIERETVINVSTEQSSTFSSSAQVKALSLTWEQFILINVEMDRLAGYVRTLLTENETLKKTIGSQMGMVNENESLRTSVMQLTRELETMKKGGNVQVYDLESRIASLTQENQHFAHLLNEQIHEVEAYKMRLSGITEEHDKTVSLLEIRTKEIESLKFRLSQFSETELKLNAIREEKDKLTVILAEKNKEIEYLRAENSRMSSSAADRLREIDQIKARVAQLSDMEIKLNVAIQDKEKFSLLVTSQTQELNSLRARLYSAEEESKRFSRILIEKDREVNELKEKLLTDSDGLKGKLSLLASENERLTLSLGAKSHQIEEMTITISQLTEIEKRLQTVIEERERLHRLLNDRVKEIESLKSKYAELLVIEQRSRTLSQDYERVNFLLSEKIKEIEVLKMKIRESDVFADQILELQGKLSLLASENDRLNMLLTEKNVTIEEWEKKYSILETLYVSIKETTAQLDVIKRKYQEAVFESERIDPKLRQSVDSRVTRKTVITTDSPNLRHSQMSETRTQSSASVSPMPRQKYF